MGSKHAKPSKSKTKLSPDAQQEVRFLRLAISNHERCMEVALGELKTYFQNWISKNSARLEQLTGKR